MIRQGVFYVISKVYSLFITIRIPIITMDKNPPIHPMIAKISNSTKLSKIADTPAIANIALITV